MITSFVAVMMLLVEYLNVSTKGVWKAALAGSRWTQYLAAVLLGALPGCLGAFVVVTLFIHRSISLGAVVACMIATSGDEAFVMLALFPSEAAILMLGLALIGLAAGLATDMVMRGRMNFPGQHELPFHDGLDDCLCFKWPDVLQQLRRPSVQRQALVAGIVLFLAALLAEILGPANWNWVRITLMGAGLFALFVVLTVPQHFLQEHLWNHVIQQHVPRIFAWTLAAMAVMSVISHNVSMDAFIRESPWTTLVTASLFGIIPESGPHLLFVTLYDQGSIPAGTLVASSIVQDGHGMLPLFAHSWRYFLTVKGINLIVGLLVGVVLLGFGW